MKKFLSFVTVGTLACASVMAAINWTTVENIAKNATVTLSSKQEAAPNIVDDNNGTDWQANPATHENTQDWALIDLGSEKTFTDMEIMWEASHCKEYSVYVSKEAIPYEAGTTEGGVAYNAIQASWLEANAPVVTRTDDTEAGYTDNITFSEAQTGQYILIYANEYNNFGKNYGIRIFEVRIANIAARDAVEGLKISQEGNAVAGGEPVTISVLPVNVLGDALDMNSISNLTLACDNKAVSVEEVEAGKYSVKVSAFGEYTLTASAIADGKTITATYTLSVAYNWSGIENIATGKEIQGRVKADTEDANPPKNAVDGNLETYYVYNGEWGGGDSWLLVDLGKEYVINAIGAFYSNANGDTYTYGLSGGTCMFGYATDASAIEDKIAAEGTDYVWNVTEGWTFTNAISRISNGVTTHAFSAPVHARYIVIKDADNPLGKPCVNEIYVSGEEYTASVATKIEVSADNNDVVTGTEVTLSAKVFDQYGAEMADQAVTYNCDNANATVNGDKFSASATGNYTVTATCGDLSATTVIRVVAKADEKLSAEQLANTAILNDTELENVNVFAGNEIQIANLPATLEIEFENTLSFSLICINWEAACPSDYTVVATYADGSSETVLTVSDRAFVGGVNPVDKIIGNGDNLDQVTKLTFNITARKGHDYALRLLGIDAYGTVDVSTSIDDVIGEADSMVDVYTLQGVKVRSNVKAENALEDLPHGIYIVGGRKVIR